MLLTPANNTTVSSSRLEWQTPSYSLYTSNPYRIQVDDDPAFSSINKNYYTINTYYTPSLSFGSWNWRVKAKDSSGSWSDWSAIWSFVLTEATPSPTSTPTPTPKPTPTPTPKPTAKPSPTATPIPTHTPIPAPTISSSANPSEGPSFAWARRIASSAYQIATVAGAQTSTPEGKVDIKDQKQTNPFIWIGLVLIFMGISSVGYIYLKSNGKIHFKFRK